MARTDWGRVGRRVRKLRQQRGWSQRTLADGRLSIAAISQIETGQRKPSPGVLRFLASRFATTEEYLLTGREPGLEARLRLETEECRLACHQGRAAEALDRTERLLELAHRFELTTAEATAREVRALALQKQSRFEEAIEEFDTAAELRSSGPPEHRVTAVTGRARCLFLMSDVRHALHVLESYLIELHRRPVPDPNALAHVYTALVGPYFKSGLVDKARTAADEAARLAPRVTEPDVVGCTYINLAGVYLGDELVDDALRALAKAEEFFQQLQWTGEIATAQLAQGMTFIEKEDWDEARVRLQAALETLQRMPDRTTHAGVLNQLGRVERMSGNIPEARRHLSKALELVSEGNLNERGLAQRELGLCARSQGDLDGARRWMTSAIDSYRAASNAQQVGVTFIELGDLEREAGNEGASSRLYREGLEAATSRSAAA